MEVGFGAALEQDRDEPRVTTLASKHEGRPTLNVREVEICTMRDEKLRRLVMAILRRALQSGVTIPISKVDLGVALE